MNVFEAFRTSLIDNISKNPTQHVFRIKATTVEDVYKKAVDYFNIPLKHIRFEVEEAHIKENKDNMFEAGKHIILAYPAAEYLQKKDDVAEKNKDGEIFVRLAKGLIFMMVTAPKQNGVAVTMPQALEKLKDRISTERADRSFIKQVVQEAQGRWMQVGEFLYSGGEFDAKCNARVSENIMTAFVLLKPPGVGGADLIVDEIKYELEGLGVQYGLDKKKLVELERNPVYNQWIEVASGLLVQDGVNARIILAVQKQKNPIDQKKRLDKYKNLSLITTVKIGELVAVKQSITEGKKGYTVLGEVIFPKDAVDIRLEDNSDISISADGMQAIARKNGAVYLKKNKIVIEELWVIEDDLAKIESIDFPGSVIVNGDIPAEFEVKVHGSLEVSGGVASANVWVGKNLIVSRGIHSQDKEGVIHVEGSLFTRFVENSNLRVGGDCIIEDAIINSTVSSGGRIIVVDGRGRVVNTTLVSPTHIQTKNVGTMMGAKTSLKILSLYDEREKLEKINILIADKKKEVLDIKRFLGENVEYVKGTQVDSMQKKLFIEKATRVKELQKELQRLTFISEKAKTYLKNMQTNGKIVIEGRMQDGGIITIDEKSMEFHDSVKGGVFYMRDGIIAQRAFDVRTDSVDVEKIKKDVFFI